MVTTIHNLISCRHNGLGMEKIASSHTKDVAHNFSIIIIYIVTGILITFWLYLYWVVPCGKIFKRRATHALICETNFSWVHGSFFITLSNVHISDGQGKKFRANVIESRLLVDTNEFDSQLTNYNYKVRFWNVICTMWNEYECDCTCMYVYKV